MESLIAFSTSVGVQDVTVVDLALTSWGSFEWGNTFSAAGFGQTVLFTSVDDTVSTDVVEVVLTDFASASLILETSGNFEMASSVFSEEKSISTFFALIFGWGNTLTVLKSVVSFTDFAFS